jgi:uncharacterized protein YggE
MRSLILAAIALAAAIGVAAAQTPAAKDATLTVRGQGRVQVPPDHANLTSEVVTKGRSAEEATAAHRERAARAVDALREMKSDGVAIEQSNFRLAETRNPPAPVRDPRQGETEYQAVTTFELKLGKIDAVDRAVTALASSGLFQLRSLRFGIEDHNPGMHAAREKAVADARERAATYAKAAGVALGDIVKIEDTDARGMMQLAAPAPMMRGVQVMPPENLALTASVTMTWRIGARP